MRKGRKNVVIIELFTVLGEILFSEQIFSMCSFIANDQNRGILKTNLYSVKNINKKNRLI